MAKLCFPQEHAADHHYHRPQSISSSVAWRLLLARVLTECVSDPTLANLQQKWKIWAEHARKHFHQIIDRCSDGLATLKPADTKFRAPSGASADIIQDFFGIKGSYIKPTIRITTFHQIKGETLDAAMVVSSPTKKGDGGHWTHWLTYSFGYG